jgi:adenylate cyclase
MSPLDSFAGIYTAFHGLTLLGNRRFAEALPFLRRSILAFPEFPGHHNALISCCGHLGLHEEAQAHIQQRNRIGPPITLAHLRRNLRHHAHCALFVEGLAKAGVPE